MNDKVIKPILEKLKFNMVTDRKSESAILLSSLSSVHFCETMRRMRYGSSFRFYVEKGISKCLLGRTSIVDRYCHRTSFTDLDKVSVSLRVKFKVNH